MHEEINAIRKDLGFKKTILDLEIESNKRKLETCRRNVKFAMSRLAVALKKVSRVEAELANNEELRSEIYHSLRNLNSIEETMAKFD